MATENRQIAIKWWNSLERNIQIRLCNIYINPTRFFETITGFEIEKIYNYELKSDFKVTETQYIYRPESKIEKDKIIIYGAGKFNEEKLILNKTEAAMLLVELHKFINKE